MQSLRKSLSVFTSDRIRMHPNAFTEDGITGLAIEPYLVLPLDASDQQLTTAMEECLANSRNDLTIEEWRRDDSKAFFKAMGVRSQKAMGPGAIVLVEDGVCTVRPISRKGVFGKAVETDEEGLLGVVKGCLKSPLMQKK